MFPQFTLNKVLTMRSLIFAGILLRIVVSGRK